MPENKWLEFENFKFNLPVPYTIYADFESLLVKINSCAPDPERSSTVPIANHIPCGYARKWNPAVYLQVDDHVDPGKCPAAVSSKKKQDFLHMEFYHHLPSWDMNEQMSYFSSFSDEWSRGLKSVRVQKQRSCRDESPDPSMSKIVLRDLIISSKYYKEEEAKELLEVITAERLETEQHQKLKRQEQLSIEKLRLEIELSRNANQSATQNNGQTSRVKSLDEIVKMVRLLTVKVPNKSDGWDYFFSSLEKAFASEMVSDELKPKVLLCMLGDKVSNLLVNLGEEELKDYESLKQGNPTMNLRELNGMIVKGEVLMVVVWGKQPFGEKKTDKFSSRKNFDKGVDNKRLNVNKVSTEGTELEDGTVTARVDLLGKVIPRRAIEDKLSKLVKTSISVDGKLVHALVDSGTEISVIKKDLVPGISVEGASTIYLKGIFGPAVKCPLVYVPIGLATGGQVNVVHQRVLCALAEVLVEDVLLPPDVLDMLGGAQSEENSLAQSSQDLRVDSGNVDETEVSLGILPEKAQEHIEDSQRNITSCRNEVGTLGTKDEEVTAEMDKGSMVADSFRSEQECCAELALAWKYAKEGKGNYYEVDGYLFRRDKILGESIGQLVIPKCRRTEVLRLAHTSVFSSHMGPKKTIERIKYSFFWEGLRADVKKFCESCKECQLTRSVRIKDRSSSTPVARPELPFEVGNMDLIGPIDPPSLKGHKYILRLVDQHTRWGEAVPLTSLSAKVTCEAWLNIFSRTENYLLSKREGFVEKNSAASWVTVLDLWKWYFCLSLTKNYAACFMSFGICMTKKVRFKIEYTSYGCNLTAQVLRMLEQFVISRIVDIDLLMQIWKNRVKRINFVLGWVGSEIILAKGKLKP
ncbi:retrovirus-related Pol polyprotein from transposon opus [Trichonephila clavipes]|nr:retrovirus-related Pol polyprotein from transposon opus [Trichonephila clavipes]